MERGRRQEVGRMKAKVGLMYPDRGKDIQSHTIELKDGLKGTRLFTAIDKAVRKGDFGDWTRWVLLDIIEKGEPGYEQ